jgi:GNAT superfamily N-acetyltransferase
VNKSSPAEINKTRILPLTRERWPDLEQLFGAKGGCGGCWCMSWRTSRKEFNEQKGAGNKSALRRRVIAGKAPGLLLYADGLPVGWCSLGPRDEFPALERSRVWAPVDDKPVWSINCLFVLRPFRNQGLSVALLKGAIAYARTHGAKILEGYPQDLGTQRLPDAFVWTGVIGSFKRAGFEEAMRRSRTKPIMRYYLRTA